MAAAILGGAIALIVVTLAGLLWLARRDGEKIDAAASTAKTSKVQNAMLLAAVNRPDPVALDGKLRDGSF